MSTSTSSSQHDGLIVRGVSKRFEPPRHCTASTWTSDPARCWPCLARTAPESPLFPGLSQADSANDRAYEMAGNAPCAIVAG